MVSGFGLVYAASTTVTYGAPTTQKTKQETKAQQEFNKNDFFFIYIIIFVLA